MYTQYITIGEHIIPQLYMGCPQSSYGGYKFPWHPFFSTWGPKLEIFLEAHWPLVTSVFNPGSLHKEVHIKFDYFPWKMWIYGGKMLFFDGDIWMMVNRQKTMESHHFLARKIHYFDWAIFNSKLLVYRYFPWKWMMLKNLTCFPCQKCYFRKIGGLDPV